MTVAPGMIAVPCGTVIVEDEALKATFGRTCATGYDVACILIELTEPLTVPETVN